VSEPKLNFEEIDKMLERGALGMKEYRDWIAAIDPVFAEIRSDEVDTQIEELAMQYRNLRDRWEQQINSNRSSYGGVKVDELSEEVRDDLDNPS
jgi:hypothetical protein